MVMWWGCHCICSVRKNSSRISQGSLGTHVGPAYIAHRKTHLSNAELLVEHLLLLRSIRQELVCARLVGLSQGLQQTYIIGTAYVRNVDIPPPLFLEIAGIFQNM